MDEAGYPRHAAGLLAGHRRARRHASRTSSIRSIGVVNEGLATPELRNRIIGLGGEPEPRSRQEFAAYIADQKQRWGEVIRVTGVTVE